jgi:hypothetical protein
MYASVGSNPSNAGLFYSGTGRARPLNVSSPTNVWVKACGTGGCSNFSSVKTANVHPGCN